VSVARFLQEAERFARNAGPAVVAGRDLLVAGRDLQRSLRGSPAHQFAATHGGRPAETDERVDVPNAGAGLVLLGELDAILYWADKGEGMERHVHDFAESEGRKVGPLPLLCFASDGSGLVIARGDSRYTVTAHGIEG
jgi:hypothetical protein